MKKISPERAGIPSSSIASFLRDLRESRFNMHSLLILRHGDLIAEAYREPYDRSRRHRMYSISKTFTALAAGLLIDEGRLSLDDRVCKFFPEYCPAPVHPLLEAATIRDMLTMRDPHDETSHGFGIAANWLESWFLTPPTHPPGTVFQYNTTSTNLVAAIVERVTGMKMIDYMYPRLLTPIGFSDGCFCGETPDGDSFGGAAVMCTPMDLARLAQFVMNGGVWDGRRLVSEKFISDLRSKQADTNIMGIPAEGMYGYGYFTWRLKHDGFAFFGIHGQFALGFPQSGLVVVTTGNTTDNYANENDILFSQFTERVYNHLLPALSDAPLPEDDAAPDDFSEPFALPHILAPGTPETPDNPGIGKTYTMHPNRSGWKTVRLEFSNDGASGKLCYVNRRGEKEIAFGLGRAIPIKFPDEPARRASAPEEPFDAYASAGWVDDRTLAVCVYGVTVGYMHLNAVFGDGVLTIIIKPANNGYYGDYGGYMYGPAE